MKSSLKILIFIITTLCFASCGKGYEVRVTNYYIEEMDSVIVSDKLYFVDLKRQETTAYQKLPKGTYSIKAVTKSKKRLGSSITIPSKKTGKRTIQIDGQGTILILKD